MNKEEIFLKCKEYILEKGFENFDIRGLTKRLGISIGTFYNYFKSKEDLFCQIFIDDFNKTLKEIENSIENKNFDEKIEIFLKNLRKFMERYRSSMKFIFESFVLRGEKPKKIFEGFNLVNFLKEKIGIKDDYMAELLINLIFFHIKRRESDDKKFINIVKKIFEEDL